MMIFFSCLYNRDDRVGIDGFVINRMNTFT
jgi:hypothetical protein